MLICCKNEKVTTTATVAAVITTTTTTTTTLIQDDRLTLLYFYFVWSVDRIFICWCKVHDVQNKDIFCKLLIEISTVLEIIYNLF